MARPGCAGWPGSTTTPALPTWPAAPELLLIFRRRHPHRLVEREVPGGWRPFRKRPTFGRAVGVPLEGTTSTATRAATPGESVTHNASSTVRSHLRENFTDSDKKRWVDGAGRR